MSAITATYAVREPGEPIVATFHYGMPGLHLGEMTKLNIFVSDALPADEQVAWLLRLSDAALDLAGQVRAAQDTERAS